MHSRRHIPGLLLGFFLGLAAAPPAWAEPQRDRIGNDAPVLASVDAIYGICLSQCAESSVYRMEWESCERTCADLRRNFPFLDEAYDSYERCARDMDNLDLNRDVLAQKAADACMRTSTHIHKRQGCRAAVAVFYKNATTEQVCLRQPSSLAAGSPLPPPVPLAASPPAVPDRSAGDVPQSAGSAADMTSAPPAGQQTVSGKESSPAAPLLVSGPLLRDTPKYQTPEEVAKTRRRGKGTAGPPAPAVKRPEAATPPAAPTEKRTEASASAPPAAPTIRQPETPTPPDTPAVKQPEAPTVTPPAAPIAPAPAPPGAASAPDAPASLPGPAAPAEVPPPQAPAVLSVPEVRTPPATPPPGVEETSGPTPPAIDAPAPPAPEAPLPRPETSIAPPATPPSGATVPERPLPESRQPAQPAPPTGQGAPSSDPSAAPSRMPLSRLLQIPPSSETDPPQETGSAATLLPPTPSMLKQHEPTPPTLR
jgi:hypothetical protein